MTRFLRLVGVAHSRCCGLLSLALYELLGPEPPQPGIQPAAMTFYRSSNDEKEKAA